MPWPPHALGLAGIVVSVGVAALLAFQPTSHAGTGEVAPTVPSPTVAPTWDPSAAALPGLPLQCADGTWTRTTVRGGCWRHGGVVY
jgi:hypothetical protein